MGITAELFIFTPPKNPDLPILVTFYGDYMRLLEERISSATRDFANLGLSLDIAGLIEVRGGYKLGDTDRNLALGVGLNTESLSFNYALVPFETGFGTAHSIGLEYFF
ncbi:MAG: hypothetical protein U5K69_19375 [Balneolaceae bacterium]|nr:hypothetical protein [Balneolaceae bacterium]